MAAAQPLRFRADCFWIDLPTFDGNGHPIVTGGASSMAGPYILGPPRLNTWDSGHFLGVADDARHLVDTIAQRCSVDRLSIAARTDCAAAGA